MRKSLFRASLLVALLLASACSTTRTFVDYSRGALYSTETVGNVAYVEVGPASASQRGFFWNNCWELAEKAVTKLRATAEQRGANNVIAVRWLNHADGSYTEKPICTTGWGWFTAAVLPGLGPWVKVTEVQGRLVRAENTSLAHLRNEVTQLSAAWQQREQAILAEMEKSDVDRDVAVQTIALAEKAAVEKAAADKAAAEQAAAQQLAAERAAAQRAAAERAEAERLAYAQQTAGQSDAAKKAAARKAWLKKEAARKAAEQAQAPPSQ